MNVQQIVRAEDFAKAFGVSRETIEKFQQYEQLLIKWNQSINLVSPNTISNIWHRHFADSAQLFKHCPRSAKSWIDIGSGAGFPAMVVALLAEKLRPELKFTLVESDQRKCAFLHNLAHTLNLSIEIQSKRVEDITNQKFDVISARALAPLSDLLAIAKPLSGKMTVCLFPKGNKHESELTEARKVWHIEEDQIPSLTERQAVILRIESFSRA